MEMPWSLPWSPTIGVCSWSLRPRTPAELVERVGSTGLSAVQLALTPLVEVAGAWGATAAILRDAGISIVSGMLETVGEDYSSIERIAATGGVRPDATWPRTRERAARVADVAATLGLSLVTFHAGFLPHDPRDPERARMLDRLRDVASIFALRGVHIAFETGQEPAATLVECLEALAAPTVGVNFDPANMLLYGSGDPVDALRRLTPYVRQVHVKDAIPSGRSGEWGAEVPVGAGRVDWAAFFAALTPCRHRPNLIIEREAGDKRVEDVRTARDFLARRSIG
ncbi:MAG: sugar phosphate isomerase/epimerase family protein [Phycisphaerales bacterium]